MESTLTLNPVESELSRGAQLSIIALVNALVVEAHRLHASDVHIDPCEDAVRVRMRIDGVLIDSFSLEKRIHNEVVSRIKVLAYLRTDEHHTAQDGRFRLAVGISQVDIRVSIVPTYWGEDVVLRLLGEREETRSLAGLGFSPENEEKIRAAIARPHGMILATGPTGSGKTTTLYTLIKMLNTANVSIVTIEDPIEYAIEGVKQIQTTHGRGLTFGSGLRSLVRQDPDIIMVGEIRDAETAGIAINTALTGHLLLSTLHTNDAATTLPRLLDMGIDAYLVASTVSVAIGQRLVRCVCKACKKEYRLSESEREALGRSFGNVESTDVFARGAGCAECKGTGYRGRTSIAEVLVVDDEVQGALLNKAPAAAISQLAQRRGMQTMRMDGLSKARAGITTVSEVLRSVSA